MKAEDTIIKLDTQNISLQVVMSNILKSQAEISFKMGYNQALKEIKNGLMPSDMV
jgi:hypothetical protein